MVAFIEPEGLLVTRYIEGEVVVPEALREPEPLRRVAQALRAVHGGPPIPARFDSFRVVEAYAATAAAHGVALPAPSSARGRRRPRRARGGRPRAPCHNDLLTANFIDDGSRIRIVDWEYAGMGDVYFDLANFAVNNGLPDEETAELLRVLRHGHRRARAELTLMRFMSDFREAMWGVVQQALTSTSTSAAMRPALRAARAHRRRDRLPASARLAPGEEDSRSRRRVREQRDGRHDLEGRVHRHENAYRHEPDTP